jgi:hypothetical protein
MQSKGRGVVRVVSQCGARDKSCLNSGRAREGYKYYR